MFRGDPTLPFRDRRKAILVHGCFWHAHENCSISRVPKTRSEFWQAKFAANRERDARLEGLAREAGWKCLVVWECELADEKRLATELRSYLGPTRAGRSANCKQGSSRPEGNTKSKYKSRLRRNGRRL
ncbi:very short patch repair endonuclease [Bradyrhizobium oropedii]|uniref:very short patch repair endonuclease n=1 Tax=Bradyrhizobium oropedii TaxID=1571201 RepID=UPI003B84AD3B